MDTSSITQVLREGMWVAIKLGGPMLVLSMLVGVFIAIFQAVTQIHEQTLGFIFKLTVVILVLLVGGLHFQTNGGYSSSARWRELDDGDASGLCPDDLQADGHTLGERRLPWTGTHSLFS